MFEIFRHKIIGLLLHSIIAGALISFLLLKHGNAAPPLLLEEKKYYDTTITNLPKTATEILDRAVNMDGIPVGKVVIKKEEGTIIILGN